MKRNTWRNKVKELPMSNAMPNLTIGDDARLWEEESERALREGAKLREPYERAEREKARLKAEQEAIDAKLKVELFVAK